MHFRSLVFHMCGKMASSWREALVELFPKLKFDSVFVY